MRAKARYKSLLQLDQRTGSRTPSTGVQAGAAALAVLIRLNCTSTMLSRSALVLATVAALQRPAHRTRSTRLRATTASSKDADVVVVTHAAGRMGASLCAQLHEALTQREK